jgi:hypothetical protein
MNQRMKFGHLTAAAVVLALGTGVARSQSVNADPAFVTGTDGAEDIVALPGDRWLVAGGLAQASRPGTIHLIDRTARTATRLDATIKFRADRAAFPDCPGPYDPARLSAHGVNVRPEAGGSATLYAVNQGRSAIEVFRIAASGALPRLTWIGCVPLPPGAVGNGVAPLPGGGIAATLMAAPEFLPPLPEGRARKPTDSMDMMRQGQPTGYAAEWFRGRGWRKIIGSEGSGPNGIEASKDGRWVWVAMWGSGEVVRVARKGKPRRAVIKLPILPDNVRWGDDGALWAAGAADRETYFACWENPECRSEYGIVRIDPSSAEVTAVSHPDARPLFGDATTALQIGEELWLAAYPTDRLAILPSRR